MPKQSCPPARRRANRVMTLAALVCLAALTVVVGALPSLALTAPDEIVGTIRLPVDEREGASLSGSGSGSGSGSPTLARPLSGPARAEIQVANLAGTRAPATGRASLWGRQDVHGDRDRFVREFLDRQAAILGVRGGDVVRRDVRRAGRLTHEFYEQTQAGLPVIGSRLTFTYAPDGTLLHLDARLPGELTPSESPHLLSLADAQSRAFAGMPTPQAVAWRAGELALLPALFSGLPDDRVVWRLRAATRPDPLSWRILVDARSGEVLERRPLVHSAAGGALAADPADELAGTVAAWIHTPTPWSAYRRVALTDELVMLLAGPSIVERQYTNAAGDFAFLAGAAPGRTVRAVLDGRYARMHIGDLAGTIPGLEVTPGLDAVTVVFDSLAASPAALAAYVHVQTAHAWLVHLDPGFTWLDRVVPVVVDDPSLACNAMAYDDPEDPWLRFLSGSPVCANSARIADVVYHEYGHLVTMYAYDPEYPPDAMNEAFSDYFAATINGRSSIGLHFFGPTEPPLRDLDNDLTWPVPEGCFLSPHCLGQLLGGALWHMRAGLIASLGDSARAIGLADSLFHFMRAGKPEDFDECLVQLLLQDDDDGDLGNGTPHLETIAAAFERHNIGDFTVHALHTVPPDTEDTTATTPIEVAVRSIYPPAADGVRIHLEIAGAEEDAVMWPVPGADRVFRWNLPPQPAGTTVRYSITAEDTRGDHVTIPAGAPDARFEVAIGPDRIAPVIAHEQPSPPAAGQSGLWLSAWVRDNAGRIASVSVRGTLSDATGSHPVTAALGRPDPTDSLFSGFLPTGTLAEGDTLIYHIEAADQARVPNTARFPAQHEIRLRALPGRSWDLESAPLDVALSGDWAWGEPAGDAPRAASGTRLLATNPAGRYTADSRSYATLPDLDLSGWSSGLFEFMSWYRIEEGWDGGWIEASTDGGQHWRQLAPAGGYTGSISYDRDGDGVADMDIAAFTGDASRWQRVLVPLDAVVGSTVRLRLAFVSDRIVQDLGWYVDDLKVIASQALVPPTELSASTGDDRRVALRWSAPPGIDESAASFSGYNIYRASLPGDYGATPLNAAPHRAHWWYDSQVENGERYYYAVTSVFDAGESPLSGEAVGYPYRAELGGDALGDGVVAHLAGTASGSDTLWIANAGTGELELELYGAGASETWEEVRPQFTVTPTSTFRTVARDPAGDTSGPDLRRLACRSTGDHLQIRIGFAGPLPDPRSDFTLGVFLDTDLRRATGIPGPSAGAEYVIVLGQDTYRRFAQLDVVIDAAGRVLGRPSHLILQAGLDSIEVAVPLAMIGAPPVVGLGIALGSEGLLPDPTWLRDRAAAAPPVVSRAAGAAEYDSLPGPSTADWMSFAPTSALIPAGPLWGLPLEFDLSGRIEDDYRAQIFITSNDPGQPRRAVPVVVALSDVPAEGLASWSAGSLPEGLRLAWAPADPLAYQGFLLARWEGALADEGQAVPVGAGLITASDGVHYEVLDRSVASAKRYYYRLSGVRTAGDTLAFAPPAHPRYDPVPGRAFVLEAARPNPFRASTLLRVQAPADRAWDLVILDVSGRLVRRLVGRGELGSGTHLISWDGRTQRGNPAAAGTYYAVARTAGGQVVRSLLLVR